MIDQEGILSTIVSGLNKHLQTLVIRSEQSEDKPPYPFVGIKVTTPFDPEGGQPSEVGGVVPSDDPTWPHDYQYTRQSQDEMVLSLTTYSRDSGVAHELAQKAGEWFSFSGYEYLKARKIVVVQTMAHGNRDTLIIDDYERRAGFDIRLRVANTASRTVPTVETVGLTKGE